MDNIILILLTLLGIGAFAFWFYKLGKEKQIEMIKQWLVWAVIQAEKELGEKTGQVKLRHVYDMFIKRFKFASKLITFEMFSQMVDEALIAMRHLIETNQSIAAYINK
jgi:hypothetical protein